MGKRLGALGAALTLAYLVMLAWLINGRWADLQSLSLNELGDFLAGAFGPIAILWVVLGFFQQGIELRQNSAALLLQADELKNAAEQQREMTAVARAQLHHQQSAHQSQQQRELFDRLRGRG